MTTADAPAIRRWTPGLGRARVVSLHRPEAISGINAWGARMARLGPPHARWHMLLVGEDPAPERLRAAAGSAPAWSVAAWPAAAGAVEQVRAVRRALRQLRADVVVPNDVAHGFVCAGLDHHRGLRALAVCHACSGVDDDYFSRVGALADAWVPVSAAARNRMSRHLARPGADAPPVVPCGLFVGEAAPPSEAPGPLRLLYAGRLDRFCKRVLDLPLLCAALDARGVDWRLTIAGDGSAGAELRRRLESPIAAGRVAMPGAVPPARMPGLYAGADCLVLTSAFEGWPVTVIEAMAAARPVAITTGCGGAVDVVRDGVEGWVVPTGNMDLLAGKLAQIDRAGLARMGAAAHLAARKRLDIRAHADVYDRLIDAARSTPDEPDDERAPALRWRRILSALTAIDGRQEESDLDSLLREWTGDLRAAGRVLPSCADGCSAVPPDRPNFAGACFLLALERLRDRGLTRVVLYGAGRHTHRLAPVMARAPEILAIADDAAGAGPPARIGGVPVLSPERCADLSPRAVIISSDEHQEELAERAAAWAGGATIVRLYGPDGYAA